MKTKKLVSALFLVSVALCVCFAYTIYVTISYTFSQPVEGGEWLTGDGGSVDLEGDDPSDPSSYTSRGTTMPTGTRNISIEVPGNHPPSEEELQEKIQEKVDELYREIWKEHQNGSSTLPRCHEVTADSVVVMYGHSVDVRDASKVDVNPPKPGDPVNIANGAFYFDDIDLVISTGLDQWPVTRWHAAGKNTGALLGSHWFSSLDTRIVRGRKANAESEASQLDRLSAKIRESALKAATDVRNLEIMLDAGIRESVRLVSVLENQINFLESSEYRSYTEVRSALSTTQNHLESAQSRQLWFITTGTKALADAKIKAAQLEQMATEAEALRDLSLQELALARSLDRISARALQGSGFDRQRELGNDILIYFDEQGQKHLYRILTPPDLENPAQPWPGGSDCENLDPVDGRQVRLESDGRITVRLADMSLRVFSANGLPERTENASGDAISWHYSGEASVLETLRYRSREAARIEYDEAGRMTAIRGPMNTGASFEYTEGQLSAVIDENGSRIEYRYRGGSIANIRKADGTEVQITHGLVHPGGTALATAVTGETGHTERYDYNLVLRTAVHTDQAGRQTFWRLDSNWLEVFRVDPDGMAEETVRDERGTVLLRRRTGGWTVRYDNDTKGRVTAEHYPDGSSNRITRNAHGLPVRIIDRDGVITDLSRDDKGRITSERTGGVLTIRREYNPDGRPSRELLAGGAVREYRWAASGFVESVKTTEADGQVYSEQYRFDDAGRILYHTDAAGGVHERRYAPNSVTEITPAGLVTMYSLNNRNDVVSVSRLDSATGETRTRTWTWDARHLPLEIRDDLGVDRTMEWSTCGRLTGVYDGAVLRRIEYGADGRIIRETRGAESADVASRLWSYRYDGSNRITTHTDSTGAVSRTVHDAEGRLASETDAAGGITRLNWTPAGRPLMRTDATGAVTRYRYDSAGRLTRTEKEGRSTEAWLYGEGLLPAAYIDAAGVRYHLTYDSRGNLTERSGPASTLVFRYDGTGRLVRRENRTAGTWTEWKVSNGGRTITENRGGLVTDTVHLNAFGELVSATDGEGRTMHLVRDKRGRVIKTIDGYGNTTELDLDAGGRILRVQSPEGHVDRMEYNGRGLRTAVSREGGSRHTMQFDSEDRLIGLTGPAGQSRYYHRDALGRVTAESRTEDSQPYVRYRYAPDRLSITRTDTRGNSAVERYDVWGRFIGETERDGGTVVLELDGLDRVISRLDQSGGKTSWVYGTNREEVRHADGRRDSFTYIGEEFLSQATGQGGHLRYEWNAAGLPVRIRDEAAGAVLSYGWDKSGRKARLVGAGRDIRWLYGSNGELIGVEDSAARLFVSFRYDRDGFERERSFGNGVRKTSRLDADGAVSASALWSGGALLDAEALVRDEAGRVTHRYSVQDGLSVYRYDGSSRLSGELRYGSGSWYEVPRQVRDSLASRLESAAPGRGSVIPAGFPAASVAYEYDGNGCMVSVTAESTERRVYDKADRIIQAGDRFFGWDARGNLVSEKSLRFEKSYVYNSSNRLEKVTVTDSLTRSSDSTVYHYDPLGRLSVSVSDRSGPVRILYDGFGFEVLLSAPAFGDLSLSDRQPQGSSASALPSASRYRPGSGLDGMFSGAEGSVRRPLYAGGYEVAVLRGSGNREYFSHDYRGSVTAVTGAQGSASIRMSFEPFGRARSTASTQASEVPGFAGKRSDPESGLVNFGWRHYDPSALTWTSADPIRDGHNWYAYTSGDPINFRDLWGLELVFYVNKAEQRMYIEYTHNGVTTYDSVDVTTRVVSKYVDENSHLISNDSRRDQKTGNGQTRPTQFPEGRHQMTGQKGNPFPDKDYGHTWITTNARQYLSDIQTGDLLLDGGYHIHFTTTTNTNGCIGILNMSDMDKILNYFNENEKHSPGTSWIEVNRNKRR